MSLLFDLSPYETQPTIETFDLIDHQPPAPIASLNYLPTSTKTKAPKRKRMAR